MDFIEPQREQLFASDEYPELSCETIDWVARLAGIYGERGPDPDALLASEHVESVRRKLTAIDRLTRMHDLGESAQCAVALISSWPAQSEATRDAVRAEADRIDWNEIRHEAGLPEIVQKLFRSGEIDADVAVGPAAPLVVPALGALSPSERAQGYARRGYPDDLVVAVEGYEPTVAEPGRLALLSLVDAELPARVLSAKFILMLNDEREHIAPVETLALARWNPRGLERCVRRLLHADQLALLGLMVRVCDDDHGNWTLDVPRAADALHADTSALLSTTLIDLARGTSPLPTIVQSLIEGLPRQEAGSVQLFLEELFPGDRHASLHLFHVTSDSLGDAYDELLEALLAWLAEADQLAAAAAWTRSKERAGDSPGPRTQLSFDLLHGLLEAVVDARDRTLLPLFWLTFSDGSHPRTEDIAGDHTITELLAWATADPASMREVLSLDISEWQSVHDQQHWVDFIVLQWLADEPAGGDPAAPASFRLLHAILTDPDFRQRMRLFADSLDLLTAAPRPESGPVAAATLIAAAVGKIPDVVSALRADLEATTRAYAAVAPNDLATADELFASYRDDGNVRDLGSDTWEALAIAQNEVDRAAVNETVAEHQPDVSLAVARWAAYTTGVGFRDADTSRLIQLLQSEDPLAGGEQTDQAVRMCVLAEILRLAPDGTVPAALLDQYATAALASLHRMRVILREGSASESPWAWAIKECALVAGATSGRWKALKPLLLAARAALEPGVDSALRPLRHTVAGRVAGAIERLIRTAEPHDDQRELRRELALDLIDKLKPHRGDSSTRNVARPANDEPGFDPAITEPDPVWRAGYLHALRDLGVKQTGKGHFVTAVIRRVAEGDPSPTVRDVARRTADYLDRLREGWDKGSHKRLLFHAWWWIRQAWRLSHGAEIDATEANRTRNTEFR